MHQINSNTVPTIFLNKFKKPTHNYPTNFARSNYSIPFKLSKSKYRISIRGPTLWKNIPTDAEKKQQKTNIFISIMKKKITCAWKRTYIFLSISKFITVIDATGTCWQDGLPQVPSKWMILHSSKCCIVYTCICILLFLWKNIFLLYAYLQNGKNNEENKFIYFFDQD